MGKPLTQKARRFYESYLGTFAELQDAALILEQRARSLLDPHNLDLHLVAARAKEPASLLKKVRMKGYGDPARQLTDQLGLRVITYFEDDVDRIVSVLRGSFDIDERRSEDKRIALGLRGFGYRSVHLVARLVDAPKKSLLERKWFEIQVRSILEHAWAEIEHELVYKSGISYPDPVLRQFSALAGAAEVLDQQFLALRRERAILIESYREAYSRDEDLDHKLDAARLLGLLEATRPIGLSWRQAEQEGRPFPPRIEATCVEALEACGLSSARQLKGVLSDVTFRDLVRNFASSEGIAPDEVSHLAVAVLAVGAVNKELLREEFLDMQPTLEAFVPALAVAA